MGQDDQPESELRLFLSADLEGSTSLKQECGGKMSQAWRTTILEFIETFQTYLTSEQERRSRSFPAGTYRKLELWKVLGDELIFSVALHNRHDLANAVEAFACALVRFNEFAKQAKSEARVDRRLPVKGTAWTGEFPVTNARIEVAGVVDFIGPSMDVGFRISKFSTPAKMAVSVEVGYLFAVLGAPLPLFFGGCSEIKGVAEGMGYPLLWVYVEESKYQKEEDQFLRRSALSPGTGKTLLGAYIEEHGVPRYPPFLPGEEHVTPVPQVHRDRLKQITERDVKEAVPLSVAQPVLAPRLGTQLANVFAAMHAMTSRYTELQAKFSQKAILPEPLPNDKAPEHPGADER